MKQRIGASLLILALLLTLLPSTGLAVEAYNAVDNSQAAEEDEVVDASEIIYVEIPEIDPRFPTADIIGDPEQDFNAAQAVGEDEIVDASEITYYEIPEIDPRYPEVSAIDNSEGNPNAVQAADRRAAACIDRVKLPQFAIDFYNTMADESKPSGSSSLGRDGVLIDPSQAANTVTYTNGTAYVLPFRYPTESELKSSGFQFTNEEEFVKNCILAAFYAFDRDHPEVFWLKGYALSVNTTKHTAYMILAYEGFPEDKSRWDVRKDSYQDSDIIKRDIRALERSVSSIVSAVGGLPTNYDKITYFNKWLTTNNQYNYTVAYTEDSNVDPMIYEAIGALTTKNGSSGGRTGVDGPVCEGYSRAFQLLCQKVNIPCVLVSGSNHMWNYVQVDPSDPRWYAVDVTWNDPTMSGHPSEAVYTDLGADSGMEHTAYTLVGADTIVYDGKKETFWVQHPAENKVSGSGFVHAVFKMGPELNKLAYVDSVVITGLDAPAAGAVPDTSVTLTAVPKNNHRPTETGTRDIFTHPTVTWSPTPVNGKFAANTVYTATITYSTLRPGYGLTAADASKIEVAGASKVTVNASGAIQVVFSKDQVQAADFTCNLPTNLIYDGSSKVAAVRSTISSPIHNGYFTLSFIDERDNSVTDLVKPGIYRVLAKVSAHGSYGAAEVSLGSVTIQETSGLHGKVSISVGNASSPEQNGTAYVVSGEIITIRVTPNAGYRLSAIRVIRSDNGQQVPLSSNGSAYTFKMPTADVSIQVDFSIS